MTSCLIRNDYNVIFSFFLLLILNNFYNDDSKFFSKVIIQILLLLSFYDIIWMIFTFPLWNHEKENDIFWNHLSTIHTMGKIFAFFELALKLITIFFIFNSYKTKYPDQTSK